MNLSRLDDGARCRRRGETLGGLLVTLSIIGALGVTAAVVAPRYLVGAVKGHPSDAPGVGDLIKARNPTHGELIDALTRLIARSVGILAIHHRGPGPYLELILWLDDDINPGRPDAHELAILSHSRILQTLTLYRRPSGAPSDWGGAGGLWASGDSATDPSFCVRWRADSDVRALVLMRGVSDMRVEPVASPHASLQRLRILLSWAADSVDGADEASAMVDTVMFPSADRPGGSS